MKSNAPWSVKGIERDARETAKAAAQREGMTVGEWLNQIIFSAGDPDAAPTAGEIDGLKARDLAAAIEHLSKRIAIAESKSASAVDNLARSLGGAVERLQRIERAEPAGDAALAQRVKLLEEKSTDRQRIEALRALERAVGQIAVQFSNAEKSTVARLDATELQLQTIARRLETGASSDSVSARAVRDAIEGMAERVARAEKIAAEAAQLKADASESVDADFIQKTGLRLRILGDEIKRGGDQMRTLESTISRLAQQIDGAERRSAEGVQKVAETIADLKTQFAGADATDQADARAEIEAAVSEITQRTEDRIEHLQRSFDDMVRRLEAASGRGGEAAATAQPQARQTAPVSAQAAAAPADDIDSELEDAFAALDLEDPIPTPREVRAATDLPQAAAATAADDSDDFGFDSDEAGAEEARETEDVLAEIREAFGIDAPDAAKAAPADDDAREGAEPELADDDDGVEFAAELPPIATAPDEKSAAGPDYLKAARLAAKEAAAKAALDDGAAAPKKKLTPKQRAILAARIKRRKQEAENARAAETSLVAPVAEPLAGEDDVDRAASIKARISGIIAKIKSRPAPKEIAPEKADDDLDAAAPKGAPSILSGLNAAVGKLKTIPNAGGVLGLVAAIVLAGAAAFFMFKDTLGKKPARPAARVEAPAPAVGEPAAEDRIAPAAATAESPLVRPRDLYLENISALKNATSDEEARTALARIEEAASLGHPPAQLQIGELYKLGQLYDRDLGQARMWFERAANGGNVLAMHRLGVMAARGEGGPVDPAASVAWFEKAASFGLVDSQYNLGATYHPTPEGAAGGVQDRAKAYFWYSIAAKNGDAQAGEMAAGIGATMPAAERSAKDAEVAAWAPKSPDPAANELAPAE
ncbi:MAG: hypothetical protein A3E78_01720 [Alphaproteobacteria bacterium RIFCSPHIGHO2_12_FULL_63_12]|nr:MAG: hypothetical protein A3E78_01720 [Alphaproteobacteria bacterium RIFCSPHIGHO2_12_FULL_63_12]